MINNNKANPMNALMNLLYLFCRLKGSFIMVQKYKIIIPEKILFLPLES